MYRIVIVFLQSNSSPPERIPPSWEAQIKTTALPNKMSLSIQHMCRIWMTRRWRGVSCERSICTSSRLLSYRISSTTSIGYMLSYLVLGTQTTYTLFQVNLGNARTLNNDIPSDNIVTELGLTGNRYNIAVAVFFVPYVLAEAPSNFAMKYFSPSVWIGRIMISWGIITICTAAVFNFQGLLAIRFFLGVAEAGFFPG